MRAGLATLALALPLLAAAADAPHWQDTLAGDLGGPRVQFNGQVEQVLRDGDYTCFVLARVADYGQPGGGPQRFVACGPGVFGGAAFSPGAILEVTGNLGRPQPRRIGGQVLDHPVVAAPLLRPSAVLPPWRYPDPYWGYPGGYRDPWYDPWYGPGPYWYPGPSWGLHYRYWR